MGNDSSQDGEKTQNIRGALFGGILFAILMAVPALGILMAVFIAVYFAVQIFKNAKSTRIVVDLAILLCCGISYWLAQLIGDSLRHTNYPGTAVIFVVSLADIMIMFWRISPYQDAR